MPRELGRRDKPLVVFAEDLYLKFRTSDPANPAPNEMWGRSDLNSGDKVATLRWNESGTPYEEIPVFTPGTSGENVEEVLSVQTPNGEGYIPTTSQVAAYSELRLQHDGSTLGWHDAIETSAIPDSGISRWEFEQDVTDSWGSNDGTTNGGPQFTTTSQVGTYALDFDGTDDYVSVSDDSSLDISGSGITISSWIYYQGDGRILLKGGSGDPPVVNYDFGSYNGSLSFFFEDSSENNYRHTRSDSLPSDQWVFVAVTYDGSSVVLDQDGNRQSQSQTASMATTSEPLAIGRYGSSSSAYIDAILDDVRLYSKALSASELDNLRTTGSIS